MNSLCTIEDLPDGYIGNDDVRNFFSSSKRSWFISNYAHFGLDENGEFYIQWILKNTMATNNGIIEDLFILASEIHFYSSEINEVIARVLQSRYTYFVKLACLDYLYRLKEKVPEDYFKTYNLMALRHTKNDLVKLQAYLNLIESEFEVYLSKVEKVLSKSVYPTLFYRVLNQDWKMSKTHVKKFCTMLKKVLATNPFDQNVKYELEEKLKFCAKLTK